MKKPLTRRAHALRLAVLLRLHSDLRIKAVFVLTKGTGMAEPEGKNNHKPGGQETTPTADYGDGVYYGQREDILLKRAKLTQKTIP